MNEIDILKIIIISIDGPSGSGKTTTAMQTAKRLGLLHIDTGAMYRAVTLRGLKQHCDLNDGELLGIVAEESRIEFREGEPKGILLDGEDVTEEIRSPVVTENVSLVSSHPEVRKIMAILQRKMAEQGGVVLEGRDIGSVILPHAHVKIYLVASINVRSERRYREMAAKGSKVNKSEIRNDIERRDRYDSNREMSPLRQPVGAIRIDTSSLSIEDQIEEVIACARDEAAWLAGLTQTGPKPHPALHIRPDYRFVQWCIRLVSKILFGLKIFRKDTVPYNENYIFACNHLSYADPPIVGSTLGREPHFMAKRELFGFAPFAWLIRRYNAIPLTRGSFDKEAMDTVVQRLMNGKSLMIFPEGTRQRSGALGKPRSGVGYLAVTTRIATIPIYVEGSNTLKKALLRKTPLRVVIGPPIRISRRSRSEYQNNESYRAYSDMVMEAISALKESLPG